MVQKKNAIIIHTFKESIAIGEDLKVFILYLTNKGYGKDRR